MMNTYSMIKNTINSQQGNISATIPQSRVSGVVVNFLSQNNESSATANHYRLEKMPQLKSVQYLFNNSTNDAVSYVEEDLQTMVARGVAAVSSSVGKGSICSPNKLAANKANVIGLPFEDFIDLSRQKFNVQLVSDSPNLGNEPRIAYLYFLALIQM